MVVVVLQVVVCWGWGRRVFLLYGGGQFGVFYFGLFFLRLRGISRYMEFYMIIWGCIFFELYLGIIIFLRVDFRVNVYVCYKKGWQKRELFLWFLNLGVRWVYFFQFIVGSWFSSYFRIGVFCFFCSFVQYVDLFVSLQGRQSRRSSEYSGRELIRFTSRWIRFCIVIIRSRSCIQMVFRVSELGSWLELCRYIYE